MLWLLSSQPSPVEKEKQNYEETALAPGNPRFLEQPIQKNPALEEL